MFTCPRDVLTYGSPDHIQRGTTHNQFGTDSLGEFFVCPTCHHRIQLFFTGEVPIEVRAIESGPGSDLPGQGVGSVFLDRGDGSIDNDLAPFTARLCPWHPILADVGIGPPLLLHDVSRYRCGAGTPTPRCDEQTDPQSSAQRPLAAAGFLDSRRVR